METRVLVVDDNAEDRLLVGTIVEQNLGWQVAQAKHGKEALALFEREPPDLVVTDLQMPEMGGLELVEALRKKYPLVPVVLMTAFGSEDMAIKALQGGAA